MLTSLERKQEILLHGFAYDTELHHPLWNTLIRNLPDRVLKGRIKEYNPKILIFEKR
tara:strand:- start:604 stop:774 length:171 start_codon:yes stop_codon:yes gene_type:complete